MDLEKYRKLFLEECREHLEGMNRELLRLESEGDAFDGIDTLFREAHSIKGMSGSMAYGSMASLSHALEDILDGVRKKTLAVTEELISLLFEGVDLLGRLTDEVEEKGKPSLDVAELSGRLRAAATGGGGQPASPAGPTAEADEVSLGEEDLPEAEVVEEGAAAASGEGPRPNPEERAALLGLAREGKKAYFCTIGISEDTASLSARNFVVLGKLNKAGTLVRAVPSLAEVMEGRGSTSMEALLGTARSAEEITALLKGVPELTSVEVRQVAVEPMTPDLAPAPGPAGGEPAAAKPARDASRRLIEKYLPGRSSTVRVDTRVLDELINIVGELIISRDRLLEVSREIDDEPLHLSLHRLDMLAKGFRDTIMMVRMMPLEVVTDRLPRIVRDLAHRGGKQIRFEILGQGIELDRAILEELNDVLIHLVRNAIDHGVETVRERVDGGKAPKALVRITAGRERDWVWIAVEDDGRGIDAEKVRRKAVEKGHVDAARAGAMGRAEILLLVCLPGLSTAEQVSDVSGRGVGMDVVKSKVESFGGSIQIESALGRGTRTTLRLPLTLAIVQVLLVEAAGQLFALPVNQVAHAVKVGPRDVERSQGRDLVRWGRKVVPMTTLAAAMGIPGESGNGADLFHVVLMESEGRLTAIAVDGLRGTCEAVIKPLGPPLKRVPGLAGAAVIGDGRTVLVLDMKAILARTGGVPGEAARAEEPA